MNKKFVKILNIALVAMMLVCISTSVFALTPSELKPADNVTGSPEIQSAGNSIISILQTVGVVLSVVVLMIIGIKYMMGSAEEKAEYKKTMIPYIVGAALIFAASIFANVIYDILKKYGLENNAIVSSCIGMENEIIEKIQKGKSYGYFTTVIVRK